VLGVIDVASVGGARVGATLRRASRALRVVSGSGGVLTSLTRGARGSGVVRDKVSRLGDAASTGE